MLIQGNALHLPLADASVQCVVTSPPYWGLRDYKVNAQLGQERTPDEYVQQMVAVFREVRRVLRDDGTVWLNLADSYYGSWQNYGGGNRGAGKQRPILKGSEAQNPVWEGLEEYRPAATQKHATLKPKDLCGIPWRVAFALQADGWWVRSDIIWSKPNPMPESVTDRPTRSHEYLFLLTKRERYYYNAAAIRTPAKSETTHDSTEARRARANPDAKSAPTDERNGIRADKQRGHSRPHDGFSDRWDLMEKSAQQVNGANARSVWTIATQPYSGAHFATFPESLVTPCILAGSRAGDIVLDPFCGSGTVGLVCEATNRHFIGVDLSMEYLRLAQVRVEKKQTVVRVDGLPLFAKTR